MITKELIPYEVKKKCVEMHREKVSDEEIYKYLKENTSCTQTFKTFTRALHKWRNKVLSDENLEESANLGYKYRAHAATVQINSEGKVIQGWIKQKIDDSENFKQLLKAISKLPKLPPRKQIVTNSNLLLSAFLSDMHFGQARFEDYELTQSRILHEIELRSFKECVFTMGSDMFHYDNFKSETSNKTRLEGSFKAEHWDDALKFWLPIIDKSLEKSEKVKIIYVKGNHDESMSWAFVRGIKQMYASSIEFNDEIVEYKYHKFGKIFLGFSHGDKGKRSDYDRIFSKEFRPIMHDCNYIEVNIGHLHTWESKQMQGIYIIGHDSGVPDDDWHKDNGFGGNYKTFQISLFDTERKIGNVFV